MTLTEVCDVAYIILLGKLEQRILHERLVWATLAPHQEAKDRSDPPDLEQAVADFDAALDAAPVAVTTDPDRLVLLEALGVL
jgi:hypothetical protein